MNKLKYTLHKNKVRRQKFFNEKDIDINNELIINGCAADELNTTKRLKIIPTDRKYDNLN
jgi:hypothetical protein